VDTQKFPSVSNLVDAFESGHMPGIDTAAGNIANSFSRCLDFKSGSFIDIREL
jgi:hypothetical protein